MGLSYNAVQIDGLTQIVGVWQLQLVEPGQKETHQQRRGEGSCALRADVIAGALQIFQHAASLQGNSKPRGACRAQRARCDVDGSKTEARRARHAFR